jgi:hypothetical protein
VPFSTETLTSFNATTPGNVFLILRNSIFGGAKLEPYREAMEVFPQKRRE